MAVRLQNEIYADTKVLDRFSIKEVEERNVRFRKRKIIVDKYISEGYCYQVWGAAAEAANKPTQERTLSDNKMLPDIKVGSSGGFEET